MSITDELRAWAKDSTLSSWTTEHLTAIADRIDAEHERVLRETGEEIVADVRREWMPLPVDADGAPVRIGDVMEWVDGETFEVVGIGDGVLYYLEGDGDALADWTLAENKRHHHAPTVEDVLREFAARLIERGELTNGAAQTIAEYAKRLRLANDDE